MQINFHPSSARPYPVPAKPNLGRLGYGMGVIGLGSDSSIASVAASGAATTASILGGISAATTTAATGGFLAGATIFGMAASAAIPLIGVAIAGLTAVGIAIANQFKGCGQTCIDASNIVNQVEPLLNQNLQHYLSSPVHYASLQTAALNNFDTAWAAVEQACGQVGGQGGAGCISGRQQGACDYKTSQAVWTQAADGSWSFGGGGANGSGNTCWNWFVGYRDPIANDPSVVPDPVGSVVTQDPATGLVTVTPPANTSLLSSNEAAAGVALVNPSATTSTFPMPLLLIGGGMLAVMVLMGGSGGKGK